jgi:glycosyltransferase involved in cell wall biosynthesis
MNTYTEETLSEAQRAGAGSGDDGYVVSIVMPCLNEAESLAPCLEAARDAIESAGVRGEILVADNGSTDGSQQIAESYGARVVNV